MFLEEWWKCSHRIAQLDSCNHTPQHYGDCCEDRLSSDCLTKYGHHHRQARNESLDAAIRLARYSCHFSSRLSMLLPFVLIMEHPVVGLVISSSLEHDYLLLCTINLATELWHYKDDVDASLGTVYLCMGCRPGYTNAQLSICLNSSS